MDIKKGTGAMNWKGVIRAYSHLLPVNDRTPVVTLQEGNTPLVRVRNLEKKLGCPSRLYLKWEGMNPTGSFKDRGMTVAVSKALEEGARGFVCASTGNTSASAAAFAARSGYPCYVLIPENAVAMGKLAQSLMYGATVINLQGNFDQALQMVLDIVERKPVTLVNSLNPYRLEGQKTASFEVCDILGNAPRNLFIPVGNAGNITAYWNGFKEYREVGKSSRLPRMFGFQAEGAAPIVRGEAVENPETVATAIRIGNPASWNSAVAAAQESGGDIGMVTDQEILEAYRLLASQEGVFVEAASAASVAGLRKKLQEDPGAFQEGEDIVCVLTGNGLKDLQLAIDSCPRPVSISPELSELEKIMEV